MSMLRENNDVSWYSHLIVHNVNISTLIIVSFLFIRNRHYQCISYRLPITTIISLVILYISLAIFDIDAYFLPHFGFNNSTCDMSYIKIRFGTILMLSAILLYSRKMWKLMYLNIKLGLSQLQRQHSRSSIINEDKDNSISPVIVKILLIIRNNRWIIPLFEFLLIVIPQIDVSIRNVQCDIPSETFTISFILGAIIQLIPIYFIYYYSVNDVFNIKRELQVTFVFIIIEIIIGGILLALFSDFWVTSAAAAIFTFQLFQFAIVIIFVIPLYQIFTINNRSSLFNRIFVPSLNQTSQVKINIEPETKTIQVKHIFEEIFINREIRNKFYEHLKKEFSVENLLFVEELNTIISDNQSLGVDVPIKDFIRLYHKYIKSDSTLCINISDQNKTPIDNIFKNCIEGEILNTLNISKIKVESSECIRLFKSAQREIINLMSADSWSRFVNNLK